MVMKKTSKLMRLEFKKNITKIRYEICYLSFSPKGTAASSGIRRDQINPILHLLACRTKFVWQNLLKFSRPEILSHRGPMRSIKTF